jgi:hypothetical protein
MSTIDVIYKYGREVMISFAKAIHLRYEELNILIFVIVGPAIFLCMLWKIKKQNKIIKGLKNN